MTTDNQEIEVRFPDIDKAVLIQKLHEVGAQDLGEDLFEEMVFYRDAKVALIDEFVRLRKTRNGTKMTYKHFYEQSATGTTEIELGVSSLGHAKELLLAIGLTFIRHQQKKRHDLVFNGCEVSIDEFPLAAPYLEIEGPSEEVLWQTAELLGLRKEDAYYKNALILLREKRGLEVDKMKTYAFDKIEYT